MLVQDCEGGMEMNRLEGWRVCGDEDLDYFEEALGFFIGIEGMRPQLFRQWLVLRMPQDDWAARLGGNKKGAVAEENH